MTFVYESPKDHTYINTLDTMHVDYTVSWVHYYSAVHRPKDNRVSIRLPPINGNDDFGYQVPCTEIVGKPERIAHAALFQIN